MLNTERLKAFVATIDRDRAKSFYGGVLGLKLVSEDDFGMEFDSGGMLLRISPVKEFTPHQFTVLGWVVADIAVTAALLAQKGVVFERFEFLEQDAAGIWTAPGGTHVAWFKDPDGNLLSLNDWTPGA